MVDVIAGQIHLAVTPSAPGLPRKQFRRVVPIANYPSHCVDDIRVRFDNEQSRAATFSVAELLIPCRQEWGNIGVHYLAESSAVVVARRYILIFPISEADYQKPIFARIFTF